jgi:serine/threonine-protein kinase
VSPPGAQVTIDGVAIPTNPFHARYAKDSLVHHVSATADGYEPKVVDLTYVNDTSVDLSLDRRAPPPTVRYLAPPPPAPPAHGAKHPTAAAQATPAPATNDAPSAAPPAPRLDIAPSGGHAPLRPIMTNNPYGTP